MLVAEPVGTETTAQGAALLTPLCSCRVTPSPTSSLCFRSNQLGKKHLYNECVSFWSITVVDLCTFRYLWSLRLWPYCSNCCREDVHAFCRKPPGNIPPWHGRRRPSQLAEHGTQLAEHGGNVVWPQRRESATICTNLSTVSEVIIVIEALASSTPSTPSNCTAPRLHCL